MISAMAWLLRSGTRVQLLLLVGLVGSASALRLPAQHLSQRPSSSSRRDAVATATLTALLGPPLLPALADESIAVTILADGDKSCETRIDR